MIMFFVAVILDWCKARWIGPRPDPNGRSGVLPVEHLTSFCACGIVVVAPKACATYPVTSEVPTFPNSVASNLFGPWLAPLNIHPNCQNRRRMSPAFRRGEECLELGHWYNCFNIRDGTTRRRTLSPNKDRTAERLAYLISGEIIPHHSPNKERLLLPQTCMSGTPQTEVGWPDR